MTHTEELDYLFSQLNKDRKKEGNSMSLGRSFNQLAAIIGTLVLLGVGGFIYLLFNPLPIVSELFSQKDVVSITTEPTQRTAIKQFFRYCSPTLLHRIGNGFDEGTCQEKLKAMAKIINEGTQGSNEDVQAMINHNVEHFMASKGESNDGTN